MGKKKKKKKKKQFIKIITWEALWSKQAHVNLEVHWTWYSMINVETRDYFILFNTSFSHHALNWQKKNHYCEIYLFCQMCKFHINSQGPKIKKEKSVIHFLHQEHKTYFSSFFLPPTFFKFFLYNPIIFLLVLECNMTYL